MNYNLLVHNIFFVLGGVLNLVIPLIVIFLQRKKLNSLVVTFALMSWSVAVFQISQFFGVNAQTGDVSRSIFMFNLTNIWIGTFLAHWFAALIGFDKTRTQKIALGIMYSISSVLFIFLVTHPTLFLLESVPKMYLPFYYNPGQLYWTIIVWLDVVLVVYAFQLVLKFIHTQDPVEKNRYRYVVYSILYAFVLASTAFLLVFDIEFDPMWSSFFGIYPLLLAYAVIKYQLLDVKLIIQRAFVYGSGLAILVAFISFSNILTQFFQKIIPGFPFWIVPLISSMLGVVIGVFFWNKLRENDILKYEFITIIAHKFRTPLTQEKWTIESLLAEEDDLDKKKSLTTLTESNKKLIDLTGALVELTDTDNGSGGKYLFEKTNLCLLVDGMIGVFRESFESKNILVSSTCNISETNVYIDKKRIQFVLQTLLENAFVYTPVGGMVTISISIIKTKIHIAVTDSGIGIAKTDLSRVSSKFYRTHGAKSVDTEGFGIGLFLAQSIAHKHGGKIDISSNGEGTGSTFTIILPVAKV